MEISEQDFETTEKFFEYCTKETGEIINIYTLNRNFKSKWDADNAVDVISINNNFDITFDSGGYSLIFKL